LLDAKINQSAPLLGITQEEILDLILRNIMKSARKELKLRGQIFLVLKNSLQK